MGGLRNCVNGEENEKGSATIFAARRDKLRNIMRAAGLDALLVSRPANRFYLSGFELHDPQPGESAGMLLITADGNDWLATDGRYEAAAARFWDKKHIYIYGGNAVSDLRKLIAANASIVGIEAKNSSWDFARRLGQQPDKGFSAAIVPADGLVEKLRIIKDVEEIKALEASFALNHKMFSWLESEVTGGKTKNSTEKALDWAIERFFRENGAQELAFSTIVASGPNAALPHAIPGNCPLEQNAPLLVDAGCRVDYYCSDQTRVFWPGPKPSENYTRTLKLVQSAQQAALEMMRPGVICSDVYHAARKVFEKAGVEKNFNHGLGHGVGLETHEAPSLSPRCSTRLAPGMAVTVEPGLYYPEWGGVRWEYTVLVEDDGVKIL